MSTYWNTGAAALAVAIAAAGATLACSDDTTAPQSETTYVAQLKSTNEVPAIPGAASGTATFTLTGRSLSYRVTVSGLSGNAAASHIHVGGAGVNGDIIVPFNAAQVRTGEVASGGRCSMPCTAFAIRRSRDSSGLRAIRIRTH